MYWRILELKRKNRVLILIENDGFPSDTRAMNEARILTQAGYRVVVVCPRLGARKLHEIINGIEVYRFPSTPQPKGILGYIWEYSYYMAAMFLTSFVVFICRGFDIIHAQNPPDMLFIIALFYRIMGKKFIFDHNDLTPELYLTRFEHGKMALRLLLLLEKLSCRWADLVITTETAYRELEITRDNISPEKIVLVRNSPNLDSIKAITSDKARDIAEGKILLGYVGYLGRQDGADLLVKSLRHLAHDLGRQDFHCLIIGDGEMLEFMKQTAREADIDRYITFTGSLKWEEAMKRIAAVDIGLEPNPLNPLNDKMITVKALEYMSLQKPIVAYDLAEQRLVIDGAALFAQANNELDFAAKIVTLMDNQEMRQKMGAAGRRKMENELNWEWSAASLLQAYERLGTRRAG